MIHSNRHKALIAYNKEMIEYAGCAALDKLKSDDEFRKLSEIAHPLWIKCTQEDFVESLTNEQLEMVDKYVSECVFRMHEQLVSAH